MASSIIHLAITNELIKQMEFKNPDRLKFGSIVADVGYNGNSHLKIAVDEGRKKTYDLEKFREIFAEKLKSDDLYVGYYLHLVQDILYRHFVYEKYHWNPRIPGNVEKLHRDYAIGNYYVIQKYGLKNDIIVPTGFEKEDLNKICSYDADGLIEQMNLYFLPFEGDDTFFFTKEMADEFIDEAVVLCLQELTNLKNGNGFDQYKNAWNSERLKSEQ